MRRARTSTFGISKTSRLQRSRTRVSAESWQIVRDCIAATNASTEPHSCECGEKPGCFPTGSPSLSLQRSRTRVSAERWPEAPEQIAPVDALQRSRTRVSAESSATARARMVFSSLQRSRTRVSAERRFASSPAAGNPLLQRSRTRVSAERLRWRRRRTPPADASTEPHSCECGEVRHKVRNPFRGSRFNGAALV